MNGLYQLQQPLYPLPTLLVLYMTFLLLLRVRIFPVHDCLCQWTAYFNLVVRRKEDSNSVNPDMCAIGSISIFFGFELRLLACLVHHSFCTCVKVM